MATFTEQTHRYLATCTPDELREMLAVIYSRASDLAPDQTPSAGIHKAKHSKITKNTNKKKNGIAKPNVDAAKRPLNSWMGFRSYYSPLFHSHQQKNISGYLRKLWKEDPYHNKWTILAKAYSIIRDEVGKPMAPLDHFLNLNCPFIGIPSPEEYFEHLGWSITNDQNGQTTLLRTIAPAFDDNCVTTCLSVEDIIKNSVDKGYTHNANVKAPTDTASLTFAARPGNSAQSSSMAAAVTNSASTQGNSQPTQLPLTVGYAHVPAVFATPAGAALAMFPAIANPAPTAPGLALNQGNMHGGTWQGTALSPAAPNLTALIDLAGNNGATMTPNYYADEAMDMEDFSEELRLTANAPIVVNPATDNGFNAYNDASATSSHAFDAAAFSAGSMFNTDSSPFEFYSAWEEDGEEDYSAFDALVRFNTDFDDNFI